MTRETVDGVELANGVDIVVQTCDFRSTRGRTILLAVFNEVAFWASENSANPDIEVFRAVQPAMATLRKTLGRLLADAECTAHEIMAALGHTTLAEAERYTREADRRRGGNEGSGEARRTSIEQISPNRL